MTAPSSSRGKRVTDTVWATVGAAFRIVMIDGKASASGKIGAWPKSMRVSTSVVSVTSLRSGSAYPAFSHLLATTKPRRPPGLSTSRPSSKK